VTKKIKRMVTGGSEKEGKWGRFEEGGVGGKGEGWRE